MAALSHYELTVSEFGMVWGHKCTSFETHLSTCVNSSNPLSAQFRHCGESYAMFVAFKNT